MKYLALGDSISIDDYTGVPGGGAASQFARLVGAARVQDLTRDGATTDTVIELLGQVSIEPEVVTLTAGGNDFLMACYWGASGVPLHSDEDPVKAVIEKPLQNLSLICESLAAYRCRVVLNTVYDPTDGNDLLAAQVGVPPGLRAAFESLNEGIRDLAAKHRFLLSDLQRLFRGHGIASREPWVVMNIEPNLAGATAIARHWHELLNR